MLKRNLRPWLMMALFLLLVSSGWSWLSATGVGTVFPGKAEAGGVLHIIFLDVGQGDAILLQTPEGKVMLVDGGPPEAGPKLVQDLRQRGVKVIDVLVSTHPHADHIGGLLAVLDQFPVKKVYDPGLVHTTTIFERYLRLIDQKKIPFILARRGKEIPLDPQVRVQILWPEERVVKNTRDLNEASVVLRVSHGQVTVLLTGDIGGETEKDLIAGGEVKAQLLKVAHHGSRGSSQEVFLTRVSPKVAVIQVGRGNPYGHPHPEVLARLRARGSEVYRTDRQGTISIVSDGRVWRVEPERREKNGARQGKVLASGGGR